MTATTTIDPTRPEYILPPMEETPLDATGVAKIFARTTKLLMGAKHQYGQIPKELQTPEVARLLRAVIDVTYWKDAWTRLPSQHMFDDLLKDTIRARTKAQAQGHSSEPCTVVFIDLNHFKKYNDDLGVTEADYLIKFIAKVLYTELGNPKVNLLARSNKRGDEFMILMDGIDQKHADMIVEKLFKILKSKRIRMNNTGKIVQNVTFAHGCYELDSDLKAGETETYKTAIEKAELKMKARKEELKVNDKIAEDILEHAKRDNDGNVDPEIWRNVWRISTVPMILKDERKGGERNPANRSGDVVGRNSNLLGSGPSMALTE